MLLKACNALLSHIEDRYLVPSLHLDLSQKEQTVQLNGMLIEDGLRGVMEEEIYSAAEMVFPFVAFIIDRRPGSVKGCDLTGMSVLYVEMISELLSITKGRHARQETWQACGRRFQGSRLLLREPVRSTAHLLYLH